MKTILFGVALSLAAGSLAGQEAAPPAFPVRTEVVILDMVVRDDDGQPVIDLRVEEIKVLEDGLPCLLQSFRLGRPGAPAPSETAGPAVPSPPEPAPGALSPGEPVDASGPESASRPNIVILVFDRMGMEAAGTARQAASDFAQREFPPGTWFAVHETGDRVRTLRSDVVFALVAGPSPWVVYRDTFQVSGHDLREHDSRLARLFRESPGAAPREAQGFQRESERHLRPPERGMWVPLTTPTACLAYLHPDIRDRFTFEIGERSTRDGEDVVTLELEEVGRPTLVRDGSGQDVPAQGTLVVREKDGALLSSDIEHRFVSAQGLRMRVTTRFQQDTSLSLLVAAEMRQVVAPASSGGWESPVGGRVRAAGRVEMVVRYSEFEALSGGR